MADENHADAAPVPPAAGMSAAHWLEAGGAALARGDLPAAWQDYRHAAQCAPLSPQAYLGMGAVLEAQGQGREALAHRMAALALQTHSAIDLYNIATAYFMAQQREVAEGWYRLTLLLDPQLPIAHRNLATLLRDAGRLEEAHAHTEAAYRRQYVFDNECAAPRYTVWMICAAERGNVPVDLWFNHADTRRIEYFVEYAPPQGATTPAQLLEQGYAAPDLIFNTIGDADVAAPVLARMQAFADTATVPVLNDPAAVARTARDCLPRLLAGIDGLVVPAVTRVNAMAQALDCLVQAGQPMLIRPIATHGGEGLVRVSTAAEIAALAWQGALADTPSSRAADALPGPAPAPADPQPDASVYFLAPYHDYRSPDGYFRKYRVIFIDGQPYPYHLAISSHWLVHYFSADMLGQTGKQAEEAAFLDDPQAVLGAPAWQALQAVGARLALDYAGIDFALLPEGRVLVFEANATMLVHREPAASELAYKNRHVARLEQAFAAMLRRRCGR